MVNAKGKWCFVTGASKGVGRQIALFMAERGCNLILHSRILEQTKAILEEASALGVEAFAVAADFSRPDEIAAMLKEIDGKGVDVDIVFNDAGVQVSYREEFFSTPITDFMQSFLINMIGPAMICYHFLPKMIERGFGRIINTASSIKGEPQQAGYACSIAALEKFTCDLAGTLDGVDASINMADLGRHPEDDRCLLPGAVVGAFIDGIKSGGVFPAQAFKSMTLEEAVEAAKAF
ncbi:MAG: SDR family oxidoreductase [Clostridiales bacterium]|jgi:short-subunit dehydrogenase|nr:SDR family oxidoreductase [Clostridiales bacterium]